MLARTVGDQVACRFPEVSVANHKTIRITELQQPGSLLIARTITIASMNAIEALSISSNMPIEVTSHKEKVPVDIREYENTSLSKITGDGDFNSKNPTLLSLEELNLLANDKLTKLRSKIKELERLAQEQEMENNQNMIMKQVQTHQQALLSSVNSLRKAKLTAQMTLDRRLREEFFSVESPIKQSLKDKYSDKSQE
ncbi:Hypothetical predicted protein [Octopus vulgaris]|uniref:Uncharacterized protein n=1 Tax=Octopus vulgaris TaxID=6645 RepID=A0AA36BB05_OCTVU|nr:Hypothetical predicted protein [Octopus vulgaris]